MLTCDQASFRNAQWVRDQVSSATVTADNPSSADQLVRDLLAQGSESQVDYKAAVSAPTDKRERAKLAKHVIGLSNRKDGGYLLIGVEDVTHKALGLAPEQVATWDAAKLNAALARYAAPPPVVQVFRGSLADGTVLLAVRVVPFEEQPLVCTTSVADDKDNVVLRRGALYIHTVGTETREVSTEGEMRDLLSRAYVKKADRLLFDIKALIDAHWPGGAASAALDLLSAIDQDLTEMKRP